MSEKIKEEKKEEFDTKPILYEVGYLLVPIIAEDSLPMETDKIREKITKSGGEIAVEGNPKMIDIAYPMKHKKGNKKVLFDKAYFGWIRFKIKPSEVVAINKELDGDDNIIRFLLIRDIPEKEQPRRIMRPRVIPRAPQEKKEEIDEEKLDREIEELLVE